MCEPRSVALDPIVSLAVAIAEAPGSYAFFLGSGVSRDAGVPTGGEVLWLAIGDLYRLENTTGDTPSPEELGTWLKETGREKLGYSGILELIAPDPATRRDYLAKHFEGVEPGPTHELLAAFGARGLVRVFVTTNFDRLLERALQARGVEPIVVTSDADLEVAPGREHAQCYVLKPHGDYLQQTIRNTPSEVAELPPSVTAELAEVFNRYGVVVLGYSGADEAITRAMAGRRSRYGLYWLSRGGVPVAAQGVVDSADGRVIERDGASDFLRDLDRRLAVFEAHPSGESPVTVNDEVLLLLRRGDRVGIRELMRRERREFEERMSELVEGRQQERPDEAMAGTLYDRLLPALERRLGTLLPLASHDAELLGEELDAIAAYRDRQQPSGGYTFWPNVLAWAAWWLGTTLGAFSMQQGLYATLHAVLTVRTANRYGQSSAPLVGSVPGDAGDFIGKAVMHRVDDRQYFAPAREALQRAISDLTLLRERYPELVAGDREPRRSLVEFDFVHNISLGLNEELAVSHWMMSTESAEAFAYRLHGDARLRERVASAIGLDLPTFDEKAPEALGKTYPVGQFPRPGCRPHSPTRLASLRAPSICSCTGGPAPCVPEFEAPRPKARPSQRCSVRDLARGPPAPSAA